MMQRRENNGRQQISPLPILHSFRCTFPLSDQPPLPHRLLWKVNELYGSLPTMEKCIWTHTPCRFSYNFRVSRLQTWTSIQGILFYCTIFWDCAYGWLRGVCQGVPGLRMHSEMCVYVVTLLRIREAVQFTRNPGLEGRTSVISSNGVSLGSWSWRTLHKALLSPQQLEALAKRNASCKTDLWATEFILVAEWDNAICCWFFVGVGALRGNIEASD